MSLFDLFKKKKKEDFQQEQNIETEDNKNNISEENNTEKKKINFTIYSYRKDCNDLKELLQNILKDTLVNIEENEKNIIITFFDNSKMEIYPLVDKVETNKQAMGMASYFSKANLEDTELKSKILTQITMFNCIVSIWFEVDENKEKMNYLIDSVHILADKLSGFILYPNISLFHSDGRTLISLDGKTDFTADTFSPIASSTILEKDIEETENDKNRRLNSIEILKNKNIPYIENLKCSVYEQESNIWDKEDIIKRLIAIFATAVKAEAYGSGQYKNCEEITKDMLKSLNEKYNVSEYFTDEEKAYINNQNDNHLKFSWRYECCAVLLWALSLEELKEPTEICDVSKIAKFIFNSDFNTILEKSKLKSKKEILDLQDLVFRYNWACVDTMIKNEELPQLNRGVVYERHYTLNWLIQAYGITNWDNVQTHT